MKNQQKENNDYYINDLGQVIFTANYLIKMGSCCGNGCLHCPFAYKNVPEPKRSYLLSLREDEEK
ncbi:MAG: hypothetical protein IPP48_15530 [Chitinophagaceae bacterium]|nr:hypothetical protein [Chitinophagaceae bacterium]